VETHLRPAPSPAKSRPNETAQSPLLPLVFAAIGAAGAEGLAKWTFDALQDGTRKVLESVGNQADELQETRGWFQEFPARRFNLTESRRTFDVPHGRLPGSPALLLLKLDRHRCVPLQLVPRSSTAGQGTGRLFPWHRRQGQVTFRLASGGRWTAMEGIERIPCASGLTLQRSMKLGGRRPSM